ncbi:hypothetical protein [Methylobacterium sp. JK268]
MIKTPADKSATGGPGAEAGSIKPGRKPVSLTPDQVATVAGGSAQKSGSTTTTGIVKSEKSTVS